MPLAINNIVDICRFMQQMHDELKEQIEFDSDGWPIFQRTNFVSEVPEEFVTFDYRTNSLITAYCL